MEIEFAFLADAAETPAGNKLYVLGGGIDRIGAAHFPALHEHVALVIKINVHPTECDRQHTLAIELWDEDGQRLGPMPELQFMVQRNNEYPTRPHYVQLVMNIMRLQFARPGEYNFHISVDGRHLKTVSLYVDQVERGGAPQQGFQTPSA